MRITKARSGGLVIVLALVTAGCGDAGERANGPLRAGDPASRTAAVGVVVSRWAGIIGEGHFKYHDTGDGPGLRLELKTNMATDFTMSTVVVTPGGNVGWHTHTGPVFINIRSGTLTLLDYHDGACERRDVGPGLTILEQGTGIHNGYNLTGQNVEYATAAWAPRGVPQRVDVSPAPPCAP